MKNARPISLLQLVDTCQYVIGGCKKNLVDDVATITCWHGSTSCKWLVGVTLLLKDYTIA